MPEPESRLSPSGTLLRRADPDRFLTALFAPASKREALFTLYAFNHETARAREAAREPMMALIRLQWWREVVEGTRKSHEVATPLSNLLDRGLLDRAELLSVLDAREQTEFATVADWRAWLLAGPGALAAAASRLLGAPGAPGLQALGAGFGAAGVLRNTVALARFGLCLLPTDLLERHGLTAASVIAQPSAPGLQAMFADLAVEGRSLVGRPARRGPELPAALPAVLARRDLHHPGQALRRGIADRLAVTVAAARSRA